MSVSHHLFPRAALLVGALVVSLGPASPAPATNGIREITVQADKPVGRIQQRLFSETPAGAAERRPGPRQVQPVKILNAWSGTMADAALRKHAPTDELLLGQDQWAKLWKAWRGPEKLPEIDFRKQMVLVFTADGPNRVGCEPRLDAQGNVQAMATSTMIGGPGFGYLIQCISREGVRSVNGKPLAGEKVPAKKPRPKSPRPEHGASPGGEPGVEPGVVPGSPGVSPDAEPARPPRIVTHIPSAAGGEQGIAVGVLPPLRPRYADGAPVVIHVPGGVTTGGAEGRPEYAGLGFVEIRFAFPGGGSDEGSSGGTYDYRGPNCLRALADVIRFASGRLADRQGRKLPELIPQTNVLTRTVGLVGSSHGGNACGLVMAIHGDEFPDLAFYASMESPYGEGNVNIELGGRDQGVNPAYDPETGQLDLSKLAWSADLPPGPPRRWQGAGAGLKGALFFDLNGDGRFSPSDDYPANAFVQELGQGPRAWYTPRLIREAEERKLYGEPRPAHIPSLAESTEYWRWRDAAGSIAGAVSKCPQVAVIVYANERDHVQVAPDHPHILAQVEGFRRAGGKFVRLNPDRAYVERILASGGPPFPQRPGTFPDNEAGTAWNRGNIRDALEPADLPMQPYMQAAVCELADRVQAGNWANNLEAVLYPGAPWTAFFGREFGGPAGERPLPGKPPLGPGGLRPPLGKPPLGPGGVRPPMGKLGPEQYGEVPSISGRGGRQAWKEGPASW